MSKHKNAIDNLVEDMTYHKTFESELLRRYGLIIHGGVIYDKKNNKYWNREINVVGELESQQTEEC